MSDAPQSAETPKTPQPASPAPVPAIPAGGQTIPPTPLPVKPATTPSVPVIEYAMPAQKSFIPSPALIRNLGCIIKLVFGLTIVLGMGYFALIAMNPKARKWATQGAKDGSNGPTPFKAVNQILAIPAQALGKTDAVVQANNARVGQLDKIVAEEEGKAAPGGGRSSGSRPVVDPFATPAAAAPGKRNASAADSADSSGAAVSTSAILALAGKRAAAAGTPAPAPVPVPKPAVVAPVVAGTPDEMKLPGGIVITQAPAEGVPRASAAFFFWVVNLNVSGITQTKPARVLLNRTLTYEGTVANKTLGITFAELDPAKQLLVFRDPTGAVVTRSY